MKLNSNIRQFIFSILIVFILLSFLTVILLRYYSYIEAIRIVFGTAYVLFLPGLIWSFIFFRSDSLDILERIVLSVGLSFVLVPSILFFVNSYGISIEFVTVFSSILLLCGVGFAVLVILKIHKWKL